MGGWGGGRENACGSRVAQGNERRGEGGFGGPRRVRVWCGVRDVIHGSAFFAFGLSRKLLAHMYTPPPQCRGNLCETSEMTLVFEPPLKQPSEVISRAEEMLQPALIAPFSSILKQAPLTLNQNRFVLIAFCLFGVMC